MSEYNLWADIQAELNYQRKVRRMTDDIFLADFRKGWSGLDKDSDGRGYAGGTPSPEYVQECMRLMYGDTKWSYSGRQEKQYEANSGNTFVTGSSSGVTIRQGQQHIVLTGKADCQALIAMLQEAMNSIVDNEAIPAGSAGGVASSAYPGRSNACLSLDDRPGVVIARKQQQERDAKAREIQMQSYLDRLLSIGRGR
jgi:hypothetical protein